MDEEARILREGGANALGVNPEDLGQLTSSRWNVRTIASAVCAIALLVGGWVLYLLNQAQVQFEDQVRRSAVKLPRRIDPELVLEAVRSEASRTIVYVYRFGMPAWQVDVQKLRRALLADHCAKPIKLRSLDIKYRHEFIDQSGKPVLTVTFNSDSCAM